METSEKVDRTAFRKLRIEDAQSDFDFWQTQPCKLRLMTLEKIRQEYNFWKYGHQPRFQRVLTIVKRK